MVHGSSEYDVRPDSVRNPSRVDSGLGRWRNVRKEAAPMTFYLGIALALGFVVWMCWPQKREKVISISEFRARMIRQKLGVK